MAEVGEAWQNGYAERLIRTIREEEVDLSEYRDYTEAYDQLGQFLDDVYMHKRIHSALGYLIYGGRYNHIKAHLGAGDRCEHLAHNFRMEERL